MGVQLMRKALQPLYKVAQNAHPGLLLQRGLVEHDENTQDVKTKHIERVCASDVSDFYRSAYRRWEVATGDETRFRSVRLTIATRLFIGLTGGGMLETGCAISHSYGTPYIPGSSVKGIVASHVRDRLGGDGRALCNELFGAPAPNDDDEDTDVQDDGPADLAGLIGFHDAWWAPDSADRPLVQEIVTTHHHEYYGEEGAVPATDFDSPIPNAQVAVQGAFLFVIEGPTDWLEPVERMLVSALTTRGAGARTRAGYGLFIAPSAPSDPGREWVDKAIQELTRNPSVKAEQALRGERLATEWSSIHDPRLKEAALADIRARWDERGWWDTPHRGAARKAKAIYDARDE